MKEVALMNEEALEARMNDVELLAYTTIRKYLSEEFLRTVPISGPSTIELTKSQVRYLLQVGLFAHMPAGTALGPRMRIFLVAEPEKERYRLIVHTVDINLYAQEPGWEIEFLPLQEMISTVLRDAPIVFLNDIKSCYHQHALPLASRLLQLLH